MKTSIILSAIVLAITCISCNNSTTGSEKTETTDSTKFHAIDTTHLAKGAAFYQCSMHPEVTSDKPGACPKCEGMELEKKEKK